MMFYGDLKWALSKKIDRTACRAVQQVLNFAVLSMEQLCGVLLIKQIVCMSGFRTGCVCVCSTPFQHCKTQTGYSNIWKPCCNKLLVLAKFYFIFIFLSMHNVPFFCDIHYDDLGVNCIALFVLSVRLTCPFQNHHELRILPFPNVQAHAHTMGQLDLLVGAVQPTMCPFFLFLSCVVKFKFKCNWNSGRQFQDVG